MERCAMAGVVRRGLEHNLTAKRNPFGTRVDAGNVFTLRRRARETRRL